MDMVEKIDQRPETKAKVHASFMDMHRRIYKLDHGQKDKMKWQIAETSKHQYSVTYNPAVSPPVQAMSLSVSSATTVSPEAGRTGCSGAKLATYLASASVTVSPLSVT